jgi:calcineurin-like phosphoesterase family protein
MYWFTSDEHYGHKKILEYCERPFSSIEEMDKTIIDNHNSLVSKNDITIHAGDFTLWKNIKGIYDNYINRLNGNHIFLKGSHDYWLKNKPNNQIWEKNIYFNGNKYHFVVCHYAMHTWPRSHYGSYHLFGHSHGNLELSGKRYDIGVDNNNFYPISADLIIEIMANKSDNPAKYKR